MPLERFDPPGMLEDFDDAQREAWSRFIAQNVDRARDGEPDYFENDAPRAQFFNPLEVDLAADATTKEITWGAFPRNVEIDSISNRQRWERADASRDLQDEYCEWSVARDGAGKVTTVTFTSEGPEYWHYLAALAPDKTLALYRRHISPEVKLEDLYHATGRYNDRNKWNRSTTRGAMHLIQPNNTLGAEIELAAGATIVREINGRLLTETGELIACSGYGDERRHSDPHIGAEVNALARAKADITLANPVGLYIASLSTAGWVTPDGSDASDYWTIERGTTELALRARYEVPEGKGFVVGDIEIGGQPIEFGGQIADLIRIKLVGLAHKIGASTVEPMRGCKERKAGPESRGLEGIAVAPEVMDVLGDRRSSRR